MIRIAVIPLACALLVGQDGRLSQNSHDPNVQVSVVDTPKAKVADPLKSGTDARLTQLEKEVRQLKEKVGALEIHGTSASTDSATPRQLRILRLANVKASDAVQIITKLFGASETETLYRIAVDPQTNEILLRGDSNSLAAIEEVAEYLDRQKARKTAAAGKN